ncbi:beta family protein [Amycolatopsis sp. NPDC005003]
MDAAEGFESLVALRVKSGELTALRAFSAPEQVRLVQPLLQFEPEGSAPASQLDAVEEVIRTLGRLGRRIMVDASEVAHLPAFGHGPTSALGQVADRLNAPVDLLDTLAPATFVPVIRSDIDPDSAAALGRLCHELDAGGALRVRPATADSGNLEQLIRKLALDPSRIDVIIDLQYVPEVTTLVIDETETVLATLATLGNFRTTTLLSGSIPRTLAQTSVWEKPRAEEVLWEKLSRGNTTGLRLGDYGTTHPVLGKGFPSKHVSMKYTCPRHWLYSRERMPDPDEQATDSARTRTFRVVCRHLVESGGFSGPDFSWGDREILEAADGRGGGFGSSSKPVALATSHHLAHLAHLTGRQDTR